MVSTMRAVVREAHTAWGDPSAKLTSRSPMSMVGAPASRRRSTMARTRTAADLGLMAGAPPFPTPAQVSLANWQEAPYNRWAFQHVRDLIPTARIRRGEGPVWRFPRAERDLSRIRFRNAGKDLTVGDLLDRTWTDGF